MTAIEMHAGSNANIVGYVSIGKMILCIALKYMAKHIGKLAVPDDRHRALLLSDGRAPSEMRGSAPARITGVGVGGAAPFHESLHEPAPFHDSMHAPRE